jgi:hypothetical protein
VLYAVAYVVLKPLAFYLATSVEDPNPQDPHVFWPYGSGSLSQGYGPGSGSCPFLTKALS